MVKDMLMTERSPPPPPPTHNKVRVGEWVDIYILDMCGTKLQDSLLDITMQEIKVGGRYYPENCIISETLSNLRLNLSHGNV